MKKINKEVEIKFDDEINDGYISLKQIKPGESVSTEGFILESNGCHLIIDLDKDNRILGFELLEAKNALPLDLIE